MRWVLALLILVIYTPEGIIAGPSPRRSHGRYKGLRGNVTAFFYSANVRVTNYGYEKLGEKNYDKNSGVGIGMADNRLTPKLSVALSDSFPFAKYGLKRGVAGQEFNYGGRIFIYDDRSPQLFPNLDIYDPIQ